MGGFAFAGDEQAEVFAALGEVADWEQGFMLSQSFVISADFGVHRLEALAEDTAFADAALASVGDILDLAVAVHVLRAEVAAAEDIVHQALKSRVVQFMAFNRFKCPYSIRSAEITDAEQGQRLRESP